MSGWVSGVSLVETATTSSETSSISERRSSSSRESSVTAGEWAAGAGAGAALSGTTVGAAPNRRGRTHRRRSSDLRPEPAPPGRPGHRCVLPTVSRVDALGGRLCRIERVRPPFRPFPRPPPPAGVGAVRPLGRLRPATGQMPPGRVIMTAWPRLAPRRTPSPPPMSWLRATAPPNQCWASTTPRWSSAVPSPERCVRRVTGAARPGEPERSRPPTSRSIGCSAERRRRSTSATTTKRRWTAPAGTSRTPSNPRAKPSRTGWNRYPSGWASPAALGSEFPQGATQFA